MLPDLKAHVDFLRSSRTQITKNELDTAGESPKVNLSSMVKAQVQTYISIREAKYHYISSLIALADCQPAALFRVINPLLGTDVQKDLLFGRYNCFVYHFAKKITPVLLSPEQSLQC